MLALVGFTRFEAFLPDIQGEYETDIERAAIALDPKWFPAVENRGEGVFIKLRSDAVLDWLARPSVKARIDALIVGHNRWVSERKSDRQFFCCQQFAKFGIAYLGLHCAQHVTLSSCLAGSRLLCAV